MNKKLLVISVLLIVAVLLFASCNKKDKEDSTTTNTTTAAVSNKTVASVNEYSTNENGELFVTNVKGEVIPATTGADGSVELPEDLITKTAEQVSAEKETVNNEKTSASAVTTTKNSTSSSNSGSGSAVVIGGQDPLNNEDNMAVIDWS